MVQATPLHRRAFTDLGLSLYVYNKIDSVSLDFLDKLAREPNTVVMSCELNLGIQDVVDRCWEELQLMRIYTKRSVYGNYHRLILADDRIEKERTQTLAKPSLSEISPPSKKYATKSIGR